MWSDEVSAGDAAAVSSDVGRSLGRGWDRGSCLLNRGTNLDAELYVEYLRRAAAHPTIQALRLKAKEHLALRPEHHVLDIGCGPGTLTIELAGLVGDQGRVVGLDCDRSMIAEANAHAGRAGVSAVAVHQLGDCTALPFDAATFEACYCERVLQHLPDPAPSIAIREALRILKPGGRIVFVDTDWTTLHIDADEPLLERRVAAAYSGQFENPRSGHLLHAQFLAASAVNITVESFRARMDIDSAPRLIAAAEEMALSPAELLRWRDAAALWRNAGTLHGEVTLVLVAATKQ